MNLKTNQKYLNQHAEKIAIKSVEKITKIQSYIHALVVPMCDEYENCHQLIKNLQCLALSGPLITVFVINHHENSFDSVIQSNKRLVKSLLTNYKNTQILSNCFLIHITENIDIIIFYMCNSDRLSSKQGVGIARKIGCDFILGLIDKFNVENIKWINSTDADVNLPRDYFIQLENVSHKHYSACVYNFMHNTTYDPNINQAISLYESSLHQYVNGLIFAESPYAYHTIGSLITISSHYYPLVRGFPKLSGAEDFYMLNKLAKLAPILTLNGLQINIQTRLSQRVPFGTGPALKRIIDNDVSYINHLSYSQACFDQLKIVIRQINNGTYLKLLDHPQISNILGALGFFEVIKKIERNNSNLEKRIQHIHHWFDAFKTLKFIRLSKEQN